MRADLDAARALMFRHFGHKSFRGAQEKLVTALLEGRDALGIMPTGAGKSMCYQIPALMLPGITLVVSPLISLMQDQVRALKAAGIAGAYLNSSLTPGQYAKALNNAARGMYKIIYVAPERLETREFQRFARSVEISMLAVDEAHCVSQWGHDFRPSYLGIEGFAASLPVRPVMGAFTATATPEVRDDILAHLGLREPEVAVTGFDRENLFFSVARPTDRMATLLEFVKARPDESGIVYCSTRKNVERVAEVLKDNGIPAAGYHAGMDEETRRAVQNEFLFDRVRVMAATNAFGMGIDKRNVSYVVHFNMPRNMESYYQEAGRAGRDGSEAECLLLYNGSDVHTARFLIDKSLEESDLDQKTRAARRKNELGKLRSMERYCSTSGCLRHYILAYFGEKSPEKCGKCSSCRQKARVMSTLKTPAVQQTAKQQQKSLYELLRSVRMDFAEKAGLPPELIFTDRTLQLMAKDKPQNENDMKNIPGVGPVKYQAYGKTFLRVIQRNSDRRSGVE